MADQVEKLKTALTELEGFARRNSERAEKAAEIARLTYRRTPEARGLIEAEARFHEAARIYFVVRERVREALS